MLSGNFSYGDSPDTAASLVLPDQLAKQAADYHPQLCHRPALLSRLAPRAFWKRQKS